MTRRYSIFLKYIKAEFKDRYIKEIGGDKMSKKPVTYQISMEQIHKFLFEKQKKFFKKPDFSRLRDPAYQKFLIKRSIIYVLLSAFCVAFLLLLSASTSPLYPGYCDGDSSIFMVIGKAMSMGKNVYTDYFDHKGPILFFINALGFIMTGKKTGVFIIQCVMLSITAIFMYKTARIFTKTIRSAICVIITILAFASTISDGNLSEEYCMLFCAIPIYLSVKFITKSPDAPHCSKYMLIYGMCFAACAFIRINNGVMIGGVVLVALVTDFINDHARHAFKNILFFLLGIAIVTAPIFLYFMIKGTLGDMLFATFIFNFKYAAEGSAEKTGSAMSLLLQWVLPIFALILVSAIFAKRLGPKITSLITTVSVFALIPIMMGFSYTHYYTTLIPLIAVYISVFFFIAGNRFSVLSIVLCVSMLLPLYSYFITLPSNVSLYASKAYKENHPEKYNSIHSDIYSSAHTLSNRIPAEDRDSVFGYDVSASWFLYADIMPCFRLFTLQESWASHYPEFGRQINQMIMDNPPKWIIVHNIDIIESRQFLSLLDKNYELDSSYGYDLLYKRK